MKMLLLWVPVWFSVAIRPAHALNASDSLKIIYYEGNTPVPKTHADTGRLALMSDSMMIEGGKVIEIRYKDIKSLEWTKSSGSDRMIRVASGKTSIVLAVVRYRVRNLIVALNSKKTLALFYYLKNKFSAP